MADMVVDDGLDAATRGRRKRVQEGLQLGGKHGGSDPIGQAREEAAKGSEGQEGVAGASVDGTKKEGDLLRELIRPLDDARGEGLQLVYGEGREVVAVLQGVEVVQRGPDGTRAKLCIAMGTAAGGAAHGPGAAAGDLTGSLDRVSWHIFIIPHICSTVKGRVTDDGGNCMDRRPVTEDRQVRAYASPDVLGEEYSLPRIRTDRRPRTAQGRYPQ